MLMQQNIGLHIRIYYKPLYVRLRGLFKTSDRVGTGKYLSDNSL